MRDPGRLADLSHRIDAVALELCRREDDDREVEAQVLTTACGEREAVAVALSYALRRQERGGPDPANDRVIAVLMAALRRTARAARDDGGGPGS